MPRSRSFARAARLVGLALGCWLFSSVSSASAAHALNCGTRLVERGDPIARVRAACGEPTSTITRTEVRAPGIVYGVPSGTTIAETVQIDEWTYDFGPMRFMETIVFENGIVRSMRRLGYGSTRGRDPATLAPRGRSPNRERGIELARRRTDPHDHG